MKTVNRQEFFKFVNSNERLRIVETTTHARAVMGYLHEDGELVAQAYYVRGCPPVYKLKVWAQ